MIGSALEELGIDELAAVYAVDDPLAPTVRVNFVSSLDGAVTVGGRSKALSTENDQKVFRVLRMLADAVLVGAGTVRTEGYTGLRMQGERLDWRRAHELADHPRLVLVSSSLDIDPALPALTDSGMRPMIVTHDRAPRQARAALADVADVVSCGTHSVEPALVVQALAEQDLPQILCEGGPSLFGAFTAADAVDELCLSLAPVLAGPGAGRITAGPQLPDPTTMRLRSLLSSDDGTVLLRYVRAESG